MDSFIGVPMMAVATRKLHWCRGVAVEEPRLMMKTSFPVRYQIEEPHSGSGY
jgi:hypothetical protein